MTPDGLAGEEYELHRTLQIIADCVNVSIDSIYVVRDRIRDANYSIHSLVNITKAAMILIFHYTTSACKVYNRNVAIVRFPARYRIIHNWPFYVAVHDNIAGRAAPCHAESIEVSRVRRLAV